MLIMQLHRCLRYPPVWVPIIPAALLQGSTSEPFRASIWRSVPYFVAVWHAKVQVSQDEKLALQTAAAATFVCRTGASTQPAQLV